MADGVADVRSYEDRSTGSPVKLKADPDLVADVSVGSSLVRSKDEARTAFQGSSISLSELPDVPSDDESGEVFDKMVASLLIGMNMEQYLHLFKDADVGLNMFLCLTEDDLEVIGVVDKKDRADIAHGIENIRRRKRDDEYGARSITGDVADPVLSPQETLTIMLHTIKHINNLVILLRNYRTRLDSRKVRNTLIDNQHCAALGVKILTKEALLQADLLKVQLNGLLAKLEPGRTYKNITKKSKPAKSKINNSTIMHSVLVICSISLIFTTIAIAGHKR